MKNIRLFLILAIIIISKFAHTTYAQELTLYNSKMNSIFQYVNKSSISTGILHDFGLHLIDPIHYNGVAMNDENYIDIDVWKSLYWGIYSSKVNNNTVLLTPDQMNTLISNEASTSLAVMHLKYDIYRQDAVSAGLVTVNNEQIYDVSGKNPYEQKMLFVIAPKEKYYYGKTVSFKYNPNLFVNNTGKTVSSLQINFNNENGGYKTVSLNANISHTFSSIGIKDIYFRITYTDNTTYTCRSKISIANELPVTLRSADDSLTISNPSQHSGGKIQIQYATNNTSRKLIRPLIIAEGFDPSKVLGGRGLDIDYITEFGLLGSLNNGNPNIWNSIRNTFDIVYLDYEDGLDDIRKNAKLFQEVIEYVNNNKIGGNPNIVMGISMGGLVARYALRKMETENKDHDTWKFISVDSPHKGANVPIGFQALIRHLEDLKFSVMFINLFQAKNLNDIKKALALLDSKAAKQMLTYYVNSNFQINNSEHDSFQSEYDNLGFPLRCENISIANGSGNATNVFNPGVIIAQMDNYKISLNEWINLATFFLGDAFMITNFPQLVTLKLPGNADVLVDIIANATPNRTTSRIYWGKAKIQKKVLWLIPVNIDITEKTLNSNTSIYPIDGAPGGLYSINSIVNNSLPPSLSVTPRFTFIPTVSALALTDWQVQLNNNLINQNLFQLGKTNFVRYYLPTANEEHTNFTASAAFSVNEINSTPTDDIILGTVNINSNRRINRNIIIRNGATLNVTNSATLDVSNKNLTIDTGGVLVINNSSVIF